MGVMTATRSRSTSGSRSTYHEGESFASWRCCAISGSSAAQTQVLCNQGSKQSALHGAASKHLPKLGRAQRYRQAARRTRSRHYHNRYDAVYGLGRWTTNVPASSIAGSIGVTIGLIAIQCGAGQQQPDRQLGGSVSLRGIWDHGNGSSRSDSRIPAAPSAAGGTPTIRAAPGCDSRPARRTMSAASINSLTGITIALRTRAQHRTVSNDHRK